jgi:release factor glutamine methyltransferase
MRAPAQQPAESPPRTVLEALQRATSFLERKGVPEPRLEAEVLFASALGRTRLQLYTGFDQPLLGPEIATYRALLVRRAAGEPTAYLTGEKEFWSLSLHVDPRVLIPRPDTERLVEAALARGGREILEIGTGSGAIAVALAKELPEARVVATDVSEDALAVARENVERHGLEARIELRAGDLFAPVAGERFDLVVSNPPYIRHLDIPRLQPEIAYHEPRLALDGGPDGLDLLRRLLSEAPAHISEGGTLLCEFGLGQTEAVIALARQAGLVDLEVLRDLGGHDRTLAARRESHG